MSWKSVAVVAVAVGIMCASCGGDDDDAKKGGSSAENDGGATPPGTVPLDTHPRLLVRGDDLPRLRSWAVPTNPIFAQGLDLLAKKCAEQMDAGEVDDDEGSATGYTETPTEGYAQIFAFMSLVSPTQAERDAYAKRAHALIMRAFNEAAKGPEDGEPFRDHNFATSDRSRWHGEGFALTVDWIYPTLSAEDKATIREVFLRWADEITHATTTDHNHPEPIGVLDDPQLTSDPVKVRWASNNYYAGHLRNLGLMSLALDEPDDPDGKLRGYLRSVTGAWLYVSDALMRGDMAGGLGAEGFEYSPQSVGYVAQLLAALYTSGRADAKLYGSQVTFDNPFWAAVGPAYLHSLSPVAAPPEGTYEYLGPTHSVAWFGDGGETWNGDPIAVFGALGVHARLAHDDARLSRLRWIETHTPPGGAKELLSRAEDGNFLIEAILYFMLFDPAAPAPEDPHAALPLAHLAPGLGRILARTSWSDDASWFTYKLSWNSVDHQHADGNMFELYRKGEWLTKERTGYGLEIGCSDYKNSLAIENTPPEHNEGYRGITYERGSQWLFVGGDPKLVATSLADRYVYALGDATALYNAVDEGSTDVAHASRSIVWLKPDRVVTYDRAASKSAGHFKRFWLNLPGDASVSDALTTMTTPKGQKLFVRTLLPAPATITVEAAEELDGQPATLDPVKNRLRVEAPGAPQNARFLHVLEGADGGAAPGAAVVVRSTGGTAYEGAATGGVVVLFPVDVGPVASVTYDAPGGTKAHLITGLEPKKGYTVSVQGAAVTVTPGGGEQTDEGGVLVIGQL